MVLCLIGKYVNSIFFGGGKFIYFSECKTSGMT